MGFTSSDKELNTWLAVITSNTIMADTSYYNDMVTPSQSLNESYGYLWWLMGNPHTERRACNYPFPGPLCPNAPDEMFAAMGKNGQFIDVVPSQGLVFVRMGNAPDASEVPYLLNDEIWAQLKQGVLPT
jgi:CubicO group peptidase (beta-lactamase class C family)